VARISDTPQPLDPKEPTRAEGRRQKETTEARTSSASRPDTVDLSSGGKETESLKSTLSSEIRYTTDVREDKVADVKARIESGEFDPNSDETKRAVADALLNQMGI
jgi:flagellar biosynthesis anti-sigma factor FlgM